MNDPALAFERYPHGGGSEWIMRIGEAGAQPVLIVPPLFEEMNRTRAFLATLMRQLARRGFGCWLPDLPGTGESETALAEVRWDDWRSAVRSAALHVTRHARHDPVVASLRGGTLLDDAADTDIIWRLAPAEGASLARDLERASLMSGASFAGYEIAPALMNALKAATPSPCLERKQRTVRLESDRGEAHAKVAGPAIWRRSEPANAPELAAAAAADLVEFVEQCAGS